MVSVDGHDLDGDEGLRCGGVVGEEGEGVPRAEVEDAEQREVEVGEFEGEQFGGEAGAEDLALGPGGRQALSVVRVQVSQEVGLALACPPVHRYQPLLHSTRCGRRERERESVLFWRSGCFQNFQFEPFGDL